MAILPDPKIENYGDISPASARSALATGVWDDDSALQMVVNDANTAENFENTKSWVLMWNSASLLYQSPYIPQYWVGTQSESASIPLHTVATTVNTLVPQIMNGLFYQNPPFLVQERPGTTSAAARAVSAVQAYQLEEIRFKDEIQFGAVNACLYGTGIWKYGWRTYTRLRKVYKRAQEPVKLPPTPGLPNQYLIPDDEEMIEETVEEYVDTPTFEHIVNLRQVLIDPGLQVPDIQKAKYVIHRNYLTWEDLDRLRDVPGYNIPSKEKLLELFLPPKEEPISAAAENGPKNPLWDARSEPRDTETTIDPFAQPLEILERWDNNKLIVVLQKKLVIRNEENPFGKIPFLAVNLMDIPESFYGMGLAVLVGPEQRLQQGVLNAYINNVALNLNGIYVRVRGKSVPTQPIRMFPGKIVDVDHKDDFSILERLPAVPEAAQTIAMSQARVEQTSGSNALTMQGSLGGGARSSITRTATGVTALSGGADARVQGFVERIATRVMIPFFYAMAEMNAALMPLKTLKYILDEELQHNYAGTGDKPADLTDILNARVKFEVSAASRLQARRNMAQSLPVITQFLMNQQVMQALAIEGKKVDIDEILKMFFMVSDWKNFDDVIKPMTPEDQQRYQQTLQSNTAAVQLKGKMALQQQAHQNKLEEVEASNMAKAAREVQRHALIASETNEVLNGEPGNQGFGSNA